MTIDQLRTLAQGAPHLYLTIPRNSMPRGAGIRLCGRSGPIGRICTVKYKGENHLDPDGPFAVVASFNSAQILEFLDRQG